MILSHFAFAKLEVLLIYLLRNKGKKKKKARPHYTVIDGGLDD